MSQLELLTVAAPALPEGIDLRRCSVEALLSDVAEPPSLIIADPPWSYTNDSSGLNGAAGGHYATNSDQQIAITLAASYTAASDSARLAIWATWPKLGEWTNAVTSLEDGWPWRYVSGGSWHKTGGPGIGYHWLGCSELVQVFAKRAPTTNREFPLPNAYTSRREKHSEKPWRWMAGWIERWTRPGDTVMDLYAGMAPAARACIATGRRYIGAELDPERHRQAVDRIALFRPDMEET